MRLHSYVVEHDMGFAPNPFHGVCTLAACKPRIRKYAKLGEYIIGVGTKKRNLHGKLVYIMKVASIIGFDDYWADKRYLRKRAVVNGSLVQRYGDNIYHRNPKTNAWIQEHSFHSKAGGIPDPDNLEVDTGTTDRVLIADWFIYWGGDGPQIPNGFAMFVHEGVGHHCIEDETLIQDFVAWAASSGEPGVRGDPCEWKYARKKKQSSASAKAA